MTDITQMTPEDIQKACDMAIGFIDNTSLDLEKETEESIKALCMKSMDGVSTAAVCVYPKWIKYCNEQLRIYNSNSANPITVATVVNFPHGTSPMETVLKEVKGAVADATDEVDLVINYNAIIKNQKKGCEEAKALVKAVKEACGNVILKVIIEAGELKTKELIQLASRAAIDGGAEFIKTSTGKVTINATLENSRYMLETIAEYEDGKENIIGFKAAGGVKTVEGAIEFMNLVKEVLGDRALNRSRFRFGASSLLTVLRSAGKQSAVGTY